MDTEPTHSEDSHLIIPTQGSYQDDNFLLIFEDFHLRQLSLSWLCWKALKYHHLCHGLAAFLHVYTGSQPCTSPAECSPRPWEVLLAMPSAAFQGRTFIKSMHSMKEEADAGLLCTLLSSSWHMVDGYKKNGSEWCENLFILYHRE